MSPAAQRTERSGKPYGWGSPPQVGVRTASLAEQPFARRQPLARRAIVSFARRVVRLPLVIRGLIVCPVVHVTLFALWLVSRPRSSWKATEALEVPAGDIEIFERVADRVDVEVLEVPAGDVEVLEGVAD